MQVFFGGATFGSRSDLVPRFLVRVTCAVRFSLVGTEDSFFVKQTLFGSFVGGVSSDEH